MARRKKPARRIAQKPARIREVLDSSAFRPSGYASGWKDVADEAAEGRWTGEDFAAEAERAEAERMDTDPLSFTARDYYTGRREAALHFITAAKVY